MRTAGEIKRELITLIWRKRLPKVQIAKDSRCSEWQLWQALKLQASETILRRLDAYLDAKDLHHHVKGSRILKQIEMIRDELFFEYDARSIPMKDFELMPTEKQKWILGRMHWRAKRLLRMQYLKQHGQEILFADGANYWACKKKVEARGLSPSR